MRRTISFLLALGLGACAQTAHDDPTLHPPGTPVRASGETVVRDLSRFDFMTAFPKRFLEQRVAFTAACEMSSRSADKSVAADAELLYKIAMDAQGPEDFASRLQGKFELVQVQSDGAASDAREGMMTGYATPELVVRSKPDERYRFPIYGDLRATHPELADKPRREIIASEAARDAAIAWIDDPLGWALIETNGTARLKFDDGGLKDGKPRRRICISRIATNGRPWTSIGRWLANRGLVDSAGYTFADVVNASEKVPDKAAEAALDNERVVFFTIVDEKSFPPPLGLPAGKLLSAYSCAADQSIYPPGSVLVVFDRNVTGPAPRAARFLFVHDAGGAITGPGRIDLYCGEGVDSIAQAGQMRNPIEVYRLRRRN